MFVDIGWKTCLGPGAAATQLVLPRPGVGRLCGARGPSPGTESPLAGEVERWRGTAGASDVRTRTEFP